MGTIAAAGETVVDLYAGIGYFTLPLLVQAKCSKLFACEINPDSVEVPRAPPPSLLTCFRQALQRNLLANRVADRCHVLLGDNRETTSLLDRSAHRVLLGLLPSSEQGWPVAVSHARERLNSRCFRFAASATMAVGCTCMRTWRRPTKPRGCGSWRRSWRRSRDVRGEESGERESSTWST
mmetsp:Transcript_29846/g.95473  ORF Transcript_29846/g.95473 Transcript_29846/m.95473 type:complete len:180 (+) Transcript_29846:717-1256(+)